MKKIPKSFKKGFTLVEMMVVIAIVVIITVVVLGSYPLFASQFSLSRVSREIALEIRHAQVFGLAVREFPVENNIYPPYGLNIEPITRSPFNTTIFGDLCDGDIPPNCDESFEGSQNGDGLYQELDGCGSQSPDVTECISKLLVTKDAELLNVCVMASNGDDICWENSDGSPGNLEKLHVSFKRPDPEAIIKINNDPTVTYVSAEIIVRSVRSPEKAKSIRVWVTGQISIDDYEVS